MTFSRIKWEANLKNGVPQIPQCSGTQLNWPLDFCMTSPTLSTNRTCPCKDLPNRSFWWPKPDKDSLLVLAFLNYNLTMFIFVEQGCSRTSFKAKNLNITKYIPPSDPKSWSWGWIWPDIQGRFCIIIEIGNFSDPSSSGQLF